LDGQLEFWRRDQVMNRAWTLEFEAFHRDLVTFVDTDGTRRITTRGVGYADLLRRRIIAAAAGSADAYKTGAAETIIKAFVTAQASTGAGARALTGLTVQADGATGNTITMDRAYRNLLDVCQAIAAIGGGDFAVVGSGAATFVFNWYLGQFGTDKSATVRFAMNMANMAEPQLIQTRSQEFNAILVGGQGEGAARTIAWRTDAGLIAGSTWNRVEKFVDARNESTTAGLNAKGDAELYNCKPTADFSFRIIQTPSCTYGTHYGLGDKITALLGTYTATKKITGLQWTVAGSNETQVETLSTTLEDR
jgi:hypothetical protein